MGIGSHISERRLIDELTRMGINESIVSLHFQWGGVLIRADLERTVCVEPYMYSQQ